MTRSYSAVRKVRAAPSTTPTPQPAPQPVRPPRARRDTLPLPIPGMRHRDPAITRLGFTCFSLVPTGAAYVALETIRTRNRMAAFQSL